MMRRLWALGLTLTLAACASVPVHYYLLDTQPASASRAVLGVNAIGVRPVQLPDYLTRDEIVTRAADNRLEVDDLDRWGEPLDLLVTRTLAADLRASLASANIVVLPSDLMPPPNRRLTVEIDRFEADADNLVTLQGRWQLVDGNEQPTAGAPFHLTEPLGEGGLGASGKSALAGAMSKALAALATQIAAGSR